MKQLEVHRYSRHIRMKGRLPHVPGHSPRREEPAQIIHGHVLGTTMLLMQMAQTVIHRALPHSAPFHQAPPQLPQLQMNVNHVYVQGSHDLFLTQGAKTRLIVTKFPLRSIMRIPAGLFYIHQTFPHGPK